MKKALIFTLDAIFSVVITILIIVATMFYLSVSVSNSLDSLPDQLSRDSLAVLEKSGSLHSLIENGTNEKLLLLLNILPVNTCAKITIQDQFGALIIKENAPGCIVSSGSIKTRRVFAEGSKIYVAEMEMWYR